MPVKRPPLVLVDWDDAYSNSPWHNNAEVDVEFEDGGWECVTVGYLIRKTKTGIAPWTPKGTIYLLPTRHPNETNEQYGARCVKITGIDEF